MKDKLVIYHANCPDGFTGAWLLWRAFGDNDNIHFVAANYGDDPPDVVDQDVFIVDFSYPRVVMAGMAHDARSIRMWDHHKTAEENCWGLDFCTFDMNRCGSRLLLETYIRDNHPSVYMHDKAREFVRYVDDNDRWVRALPKTAEVRAAYTATPFEFSRWGALVARGFHGWVEVGQQILQYQQLLIDQHLATVTRVPFELPFLRFVTVPIVNLTCKHIVSPLLGKLAEDAPFAMGFWWNGNRWEVSLRSREGGEDVSKVARAFGGGGHAHAAGFVVKNLHEAVPRSATAVILPGLVQPLGTNPAPGV